MGLSQNRFSVLVQPGPSLARLAPVVAPLATAIPGDLLRTAPWFQDPSGLFRPRLPHFPKPGQSLLWAVVGESWADCKQLYRALAVPPRPWHSS